MRWNILLLCTLFHSSGWCLDEIDYTTYEVQQRIAPIGKVHIEEDQKQNVTKTKAVVDEKKPVKLSGQAIYDQYCVICHRDGLAGAPKFQDKSDWQARLANKKIDELLASVKTGLNAMPAKGTCMDCSDDDLKSAIEYMLPKS